MMNRFEPLIWDVPPHESRSESGTLRWKHLGGTIEILACNDGILTIVVSYKGEDESESGFQLLLSQSQQAELCSYLTKALE